MSSQNKKVAILMESDFYENEIFYYQHRFAEAGVDLHFLTRLWGAASQRYRGHEFQAPFDCNESFEGMDDATLDSYKAIIVPSAFVADRLRYSEDVRQLAPATEFLKRAFERPHIIKGFICHALWLVSAAPYLIKGRKVTCHNNLYGDVCNMGAEYVDQDVMVDGEDLVTGRSGPLCHFFGEKIIGMF